MNSFPENLECRRSKALDIEPELVVVEREIFSAADS
jgi:hypothetical protein